MPQHCVVFVEIQPIRMNLENCKFLLFQLPNGGRLKISNDALQQMLYFRQLKSTDYEAGGVLLGRLLLESNDIVVDEATIPMPGDKRSRLAFYRHKRGHQAIINRRWQESGGTCIYLGEWHTHPEPIPTPSIIDLRDWKRKIRDDSFEKNIFILIIGMLEPCMWFGNKQSQQVQLLENITSTFNYNKL